MSIRVPLSALVFSLAVTTASAQTTALVGGRIIDGTGKVIERGTIVVRDGRIVQVGA
jgi:imidazolonepropionase-like amidohydrolase